MNKVIVLLSTYNGEKYIREQIDSIEQQRNVELLLLVRDDGSTDSTIDIVNDIAKEYDNLIIAKGDNIGCAESFLILMKMAQLRINEFDYIAFCDQDDFWMEDKLFCATEILRRLPSDIPTVYFSNLFIVDQDLNNKQKMYENLGTYINKSHLLIENFATGCTMVFNKCALNGFLSHPINNLRVHDIRLFHYCLFLGNIYYDDMPHILYRQHHDNVIGANFFRRQRLKSKLRSLRNFWRQHVREDEAKEILYSYGEKMSEEDRHIVKIVANYRKSLKNRLYLLFSPNGYDYNLRRKSDNFWFKIRILIGAV